MDTKSRKWIDRQNADALLAKTVAFVEQYVTFFNPDYSFVLALWTMATFLWPSFDTFPYICIRSATKRSGKTRLMECLSFICANAVRSAALTPAAILRSIQDEKPVLMIDEAEDLNKPGMMMRQILDAGYRTGSTVRRAAGKTGFVEYPVYCPKVFILIGDVIDVVRDRSIVVRMQRGEPKTRFLWTDAESAGHALREQLSEFVTERIGDVTDQYRRLSLAFLTDRDEEIWMPVFAICAAMFPQHIERLQRIAVDMATEKTAGAESYIELAGAEQQAEDQEYAVRLLRDALLVMDGKKTMHTTDLLAALHALNIGPWRKFRGTGLTDRDMPNLLSRFGVSPKLVRQGKDVKRGYTRESIKKAVDKL